jgi:hypothetical protein
MATNCVVAAEIYYGHLSGVLNKIELLAALKAKGVKNSSIGTVLDLPSSRVSEIFRALPGKEGKPRELTYDEGVKLARVFELDGGQAAPPQPQELPPEVLRLVARYVADSLGSAPSEDLLEDLSADLRAFAAFAADPSVRKTIDMAEGFFRGMRLRRPEDQEATPPESGPRHAH